MKLPIIIDSPDFEFAIIGPTGANEGVIIKSKQSRNEIIGYANLIYTASEIVNLSYNYGRQNYEHCWSQNISFYFDKSEINVENRQFQVLMVWANDSFSNNLKEQIQKLIDKIIFDIYKIAFDDKVNIDTKINNITWLISPLIYLGAQQK